MPYATILLCGGSKKPQAKDIGAPCRHMTHPRNHAALSSLTGHFTDHRDVATEVFSQLRKLSDKLFAPGDLVGIIVVLIVISLFLTFTLNVRTGPQGQVMGTVQGATFAQGDGPPSKIVSVRLENGDLIIIRVSPNQILRPGQAITLDVYRRMLTGSLTYAMAASDKQPGSVAEPELQRKAHP